MTDFSQQKELQDGASETAIVSSYKIASSWFISIQQILQRRTSLFITFNTLVLGTLQFLPHLHRSLYILLPASGFLYSICWFFSMRREWAYHDFLLGMMRENETALGLGRLGPATRAHGITRGGPGDIVGNEHTKFGLALIVFRSRTLLHAITMIFAVSYFCFLWRGIFNIKINW